MSGHSKWASIKHKKAKEDSKRGKLFSKLIKEITVSARSGGDLANNPRLRTIVQKAKEASMPQDNITRAIKKGTGELPGVAYEEITYEGYGPGGVAVLVQVLTDNKNRVSSEIRMLFSKNGGNLGETGCVSWMFEKKGYISIKKDKCDEDKIMTIALDAGAEDVSADEENFEITTEPSLFEKVKEEIQKNNIEYVTAEVTMLPKNVIKLEGKDAQKMLHLMELLEDHDDVQNVYANFDIPMNVMEELTNQSIS